MEAGLGGTEILPPLEWIFRQGLKGAGVRQVFVLTDGEVNNTQAVIDAGRGNRASNRCFTIGLGSGADAGLVEGLADATGGRADFVQAGEDLSVKVIPQLELSLQPAVSDAAIHIEGHDGLEVSPWPIGSISPHVSFPFCVRAAAELPAALILVTGSLLGEPIDTVVECEECAPELQNCLRALFAFETIQSLERGIRTRSGDVEGLKTRCVSESLESGVLCSETAFVGFTEAKYASPYDPDMDGFACLSDSMNCCAMSAPRYDCDMSAAPPGSVHRAKRQSCGFGAGALDEEPPPRRAPARAARPPPSAPAPAMAAPPPARKRTSSVSGVLDLGDVTALQEIDGSWGNADELFELAKCRIAEFSALAGAKEANAIFATIVGVAILRARFQDKAPAWRMIEGKALKWLSGRCAEFEQLIDEAVRQLSA
jgi:hypothetical protein